MNVIKRDGREVEFDGQKIIDAISKAGNVDDATKQRIADEIGRIKRRRITVEEIQNIVEKKLMSSQYKDVARDYINYRYLHNMARNQYAEFMAAVSEKLMASDVKNQNANVDEHSFGGRMGEANSMMLRRYALDYCMSAKTRINHENNEVYQHDLDSYAVGSHNCLSFPIDKFLENGFNTRQTDVRPAQSVNTAFQLVAVLFQLQSLSQFGGVSATHIDWSMVPYVRKSFTKYIKEGFIYIEKKPEFKTIKINEWLKSTGEHPDGLLHFDDRKFRDAHPEVWEYAMDMVEKETYQAVEGMYHNLNTLQSRSGNQLPFTSINYGTCTLPEGRMVIRALLDVSIKGIGKLHKTSIFPCGIFQYWKGVNDVPGTPNYDLKLLALKSTAKRLYPNYVNCDWSNQKAAILDDRNIKADIIKSLTSKEKSGLILRLKEDPSLCKKLDIIIKDDDVVVDYDHEHPYEINSTMGCRTWNGSDINYGEVYKRNLYSVIETGVLKHPYFLSAAQKDGRGNICPATIILPTLAMEAIEMAKSKNIDSGNCLDDDFVFECFMKILDEKISETKDSLIERFDWICSQDASSAKFMYENGSMEGYIPEEGVRSALKHGTLAIGQLGVAEALQAMFGYDQTNEKGMKYAVEIEKLFNKRCSEFKHKYSLNFGVYLTPAENLCFTSMTKFKEKYGVIKNVSEKKFFTNSVHVPVWDEMTPFNKIDIESKLNVYSNSGSITYTELDSSVSGNIDALEEIVDFAMSSNIPYFAVNVPNDTCLECGYTGEFNDCCPVCGSKKIQQLRRVTGYLTGDYRSAFNSGKQDEVENRVKHTGIEVI